MVLNFQKKLDTFGGRNTAPVDSVNIPLFTGFYASQLQDFFHQHQLSESWPVGRKHSAAQIPKPWHTSVLTHVDTMHELGWKSFRQRPCTSLGIIANNTGLIQPYFFTSFAFIFVTETLFTDQVNEMTPLQRHHDIQKMQNRTEVR